MSAFEVKLTTAGYAAFVNPDNTGTNAVRIASIGITAQAFAPNAGTVALPGEIKRVSTIAGIAIADNVIHVTMIDTTADAYDLRGFAGYDEAGTLLFVYGDANAANVIFQKSPLSYAGMSADIAFVDPIAAEVVFGDVSFINPPASETVPGVSRRATSQQHIDGVATDVTATPAGIKALLDARFGNGAPSVFVKGLLNLATAALLRVAIGVKDVATRDMGHNGGIDADMVDGKHATEFAPTTHSHGIDAVTGLQAALDGKAATGHTHTIAEVTGLQVALDARALLSGATFTGNVAAVKFVRNSSVRYKSDIAAIDPAQALDLVMGVAFKTYTMKADGTKSAGAIAEALDGGPLDWIVTRNSDGEPDGIDYEPLFVLACAALQGIAARVTALESRA